MFDDCASIAIAESGDDTCCITSLFFAFISDEELDQIMRAAHGLGLDAEKAVATPIPTRLSRIPRWEPSPTSQIIGCTISATRASTKSNGTYRVVCELG